ncbi:MAG: response regulator transcription factor [Firmicutes bacterium]|nr:response regulator transcription factor [Bacillota bacterium]
MNDETRVLVVDDEDSLRDLLTIGLRHRGYRVAAYPDAESAWQAVGAFAPHAAIVDIMLPGEDGFQLSRRLRQDRDLYILILTARDAVADRVQGLEDGADDYLVKPFDFEELVARLRAGLRRVRPQAGQRLAFGDVEMDDARHRVTRGGRELVLTAKEYELLRYLLRNPGQVLSKAQIIHRVWGYEYPGDDNLVEVHISSLRSKLNDHGKVLIQTVRGFGYRLGA